MSFREKSAWVCFFVTIAAFVPYFFYIFGLFDRRALTTASVITAIAAVVIFQVILQVAAQIVIGLQTKQEAKDERDVVIESRSIRNAYYVLTSSCIIAFACIVVLSTSPVESELYHLFGPAFTSQVFLLCFVLAEMTKYLTRAVSYRRGY